jgi:hypothetical protein
MTNVVGIQVASSVWDTEEPFRRFAKHFLFLAASANQLWESRQSTEIRQRLVLFAGEWANIEAGWE